MGIVDDDLLPATGSRLSAQLCCRFFRPGGIVRGVVQLRTRHGSGDPRAEIASVVAQIHAHVTVDSNVLTVPVGSMDSPTAGEIEGGDSSSHATTVDKLAASLPDVRGFSGDAGSCIYRSAPYALLSDLSIAPTTTEEASPEGQQETLRRCRRDFALALPEKLSPTFRGTSARVFYVLTITATAAAASSKPVSVHLPFEVYGSEYYFGPKALAADAGAAHVAPRKERSISAGAVPVGVRKGSEIPFELRPSLMHGRVETELMQRTQSSIFTIGKDESHLVRFVVTKQFYHPGDVLLGVLDFARASIPCLEVTATLCQEEVLAEMALNPTKVVQSKSHGSFHEHTALALQTNLRFCIPHDALPTITSDLVRFQWLIRFEFTTSVTDHEATSHPGSVTGKQVFRWQVPIDVRPPSAREPSSFANVPHRLFTGSTRAVEFV